MQFNLFCKITQATSTSLADYLQRNKVMKSKNFAYYACRGDALKDSEVIDYCNTWLCQNELTMLPIVQSEVPEDQPDENEIDTDIITKVCYTVFSRRIVFYAVHVAYHL